MNLVEELSFARDRAVEGYIWALGVYYEPKYSLARIMLAKVIALATVLDDMYDIYATLDELQLFTEAIERFDTLQLLDVLNYCCFFYLDKIKGGGIKLNLRLHGTHIMLIELKFILAMFCYN